MQEITRKINKDEIGITVTLKEVKMTKQNILDNIDNFDRRLIYIQEDMDTILAEKLKFQNYLTEINSYKAK